MGGPSQFKDPDVWDPPTPQKPHAVKKQNQWAAGQNHAAPRREPRQPAARQQPPSKRSAAAANKGPSAAAGGKPGTDRNYDRPWL